MTDPGLDKLIPAHEPSEDALTTALGMALDAVPIIGGAAGRVLDHALATRERERRHEFDAAVVRELQRLATRVEEAPTVADVIASDEFFAALARARREASETASRQKRRRLARVAAAILDPLAPSRVEAAAFHRFVVELEDFHIWVLHYLSDPRSWLAAHHLLEPHEDPSQNGDQGLSTALKHLNLSDPTHVSNVLRDLADRHLIETSVARLIMNTGSAETRITARGRAFLAYLDESDAAAMTPA